MSFNRGNRQQVKTRWMELFGLDARESMENSYEGSPEEKSLIGNSADVKWCETEQGASEEISEVGQNGKTEETVWQP